MSTKLRTSFSTVHFHHRQRPAVSQLLVCNIFQRIQFVQRDETDLCQLLNPHRLHLQVFCSAPWSKPLHDGLGAAAVCPNFNFERPCSLMFQQMFHAQRFNATFCSSQQNHCVTACQQWRSFPGSALRTRRTRAATSPRCARDQSGSHGCAQLLNFPVRRVWGRTQTCPTWRLQAEARHLARHVTRPLRTPLSERQSLRIAWESVSLLPCSLSIGPAAELVAAVAAAVVARVKRSLRALRSVWIWFLTVSNSVARRASSAWTCSMSSATKLIKYGVKMTHCFLKTPMQTVCCCRMA